MIIILRRFFLSCSSFLARARVLVPAAAPEALSTAAGPYAAGRDPVERVLVCSTGVWGIAAVCGTSCACEVFDRSVNGCAFAAIGIPPCASVTISCRKAAASAYRFSVSFAIALATIESQRLSSPGTSVPIGVAVSETCWYAIATAESPVKGGFPVSISYSTHPAEYRSDFAPTCSPRACSGLRYCAVPTTPWFCVIVADESSIALAIPKSMTLTVPWSLIIMFPGLISRWIIPMRCE